jgi:hypothetical protein
MANLSNIDRSVVNFFFLILEFHSQKQAFVYLNGQKCTSPFKCDMGHIHGSRISVVSVLCVSCFLILEKVPFALAIMK